MSPNLPIVKFYTRILLSRLSHAQKKAGEVIDKEIVMPIENYLFSDLLPDTSLSSSASEYLDMCKLAPSRMVGVYASTNICSFVPSIKMGHTISTESFSAERAFALLCEYDDSVEGIYDQPEPIMIKKYNKADRLQTVSYTADFLVESNNGVYVVEVKTEEELRKLIDNQPKNWKELPSGGGEYVPAKEAYKRIGLTHRVWAYSTSMHFKMLNISLLIWSRKEEKYDNSFEKSADECLSESFYWSLYDLKETLGLDSLTWLIQLIDHKKLVTDLSNSLLSEPKGCMVSRSLDLLDLGKTYTNRKVQGSVPIRVFEYHEIPSEIVTLKVMERLRRIESGEKSRSVRRWQEKINAGKKNGVNEFFSLIDKSFQSGNRKRRINKVVIDFVSYYIINDHAELQGLGAYRSYIRYRVLAKRHHKYYPPVSWETFRKELKRTPEHEIAFKRGGKRLRNSALEPVDPLKRNLTFQLPWQAAAIDDYLGDIFLVFYTADKKPYVKKAWISGMIDLATSKILALTISFKNPSNRSLSKVIRECVRIHGRLPQEILFDRGSNFKSKHTAQLLASLGVINSMRAATFARSGGEVEGLFGEFVKMWLSQRPGNTADFSEARSVDGNKAPKHAAILKPYDFYRELKWFLNWRDARPVGIHDMARIDRFNSKVSEFPFMGVEVPYDEKFLLMTAVEGKPYSVDLHRGLHIGVQHYWSPELSKVRGRKKKVDVRIDPENPHVVYASVDNTWVPCYSRRVQAFSALDAESQFVEGLIALETQPLKSKLTQKADEALVEIIEELDRGYGNKSVTNLVEVEFSSEGVDSNVQNEASLFDQVKSMAVREISTGGW